VPAPVVARRKTREKAAWAVAALALVAAGLAAWGYVRRAPAERFRIHSFLLPPEKTEFDDADANCGALTLSPDGRHVIFAAKGADGKGGLWLQSLGALDAKIIPGTEGATFPFWSPDSRYIAFFADGKLKKVDTAGSPPLDLCAAPNGRSGGWNRDNVIIFSPDSTSAIFRVPAAGGKAEAVTKVDTAIGETTHRWATFLPDGKHFLYMAASHGTGSKGEANAIYVAGLGSSDRARLLQTRSNVAYASGHLLYMRENVLLAQRFDPGARKLTGDPVPLAERVRFDGAYFRGEFSASDDGLLVYATGPEASNPRLAWIDRAGKPIGEPFGDPARYTALSIAPDGRRFAAGIVDPSIGTPDVWIFDSRGVRTRFTFGAPADNPDWSKDGNRLAYSKLDKQSTNICVKDASGAGQEQVIHQVKGLAVVDDWAPDGRSVLAEVRLRDGKTKTDIWVIPVDGSGKPRPFLATEFDEGTASFSGDGKWVCYASDESGRNELYIVPFPGPGGKWQVSPNGALGGAFFKGGREVLYGAANPRSPNADVFSVEVRVGPSGIELGPPQKLFEMPPPDAVGITRDGERMLVAFRPHATETPRVSLMTNWTAGLDTK
jgi:Tol biopolymer transport system component